MMKMKLPNEEQGETRENFRQLNSALNTWLSRWENFKPYQITFKAAVTKGKYYHRMGLRPEDFIVTYNNAATTITFFPLESTVDYVVISASGACMINLLLGKFLDRTIL